MEYAMTAFLAAAGLTFSVAIGLLVEELVVGGMFRLLFARPHAPIPKAGRKGGSYVAD